MFHLRHTPTRIIATSFTQVFQLYLYILLLFDKKICLGFDYQYNY